MTRVTVPVHLDLPLKLIISSDFLALQAIEFSNLYLDGLFIQSTFHIAVLVLERDCSSDKGMDKHLCLKSNYSKLVNGYSANKTVAYK